MPQQHIRHFGRIVFLFFVAAELLFLFWDVAGRHMVAHDTFVTFINQYYRLNGVAVYGQIPLWTPYMTQGITMTWWYALQGNSGFLLNAAVLLGGMLQHIGYFVLFHAGMFCDKLLFLAGVWLLSGYYFRPVLTRAFVMTCAMSFLVLYIQSGFGFFLIYALPLVIWMLYRFLDSGDWKWFFWAGYLYLVQAVSSVAYHIPVSLFALTLYFLLDALFRPAEYVQRIRTVSAGRSFWPYVSGLAIVGVCVLWYLNGARDPYTVNGSLMRNPDGSTTLESFLTYGGNTHLNKWTELLLRISPAMDFTLYTGIFALPCVIAGALFSRQRGMRTWLGWSAVMLLLSTASFVAVALYYVWPLMKFYRHLGLLAPAVKLGLCFLAGAGFQALFFDEDTGHIRWRKVFWAVMAAVFVFVGAGLASLGTDHALRSTLIDRMVTPGLPKFGALSRAGLEPAMWLAFLLAAVSAFMAVIRASRFILVMAWVFVIIQAADICVYRVEQMRARVVKVSENVLDALRFQAIVWRSSRDPAVWDDDGRDILFRTKISSFALYNTVGNVLWRDYFSTGIRTDQWPRPLDHYLRAYMRMPLDAPGMVNAATPYMLNFQLGPAALKISGVTRDKVQVFSRAYYLASREKVAAAISDRDYAGDVLFLSSYEGQPFALKPDDVLPAGVLGANDRVDVPYEVMHFSGDEIILRVAAPRGRSAWLLYSDTWHPAWRARVNGIEVPVYAANLAYKAVELSPGLNEVRFYFHDPVMMALQVFFAFQALVGLGITGWACARSLGE